MSACEHGCKPFMHAGELVLVHSGVRGCPLAKSVSDPWWERYDFDGTYRGTDKK